MTYEEGLKEAMQDELEAARKYRQLSTMAPNEAIKERILCIVDDELAHARFLAELLSMQLDMTVMNLGYLLNTRDFMEGLRQAIQGELGALRMYSELASLAPNAMARERIICIQKDEAEHLKTLEAVYSCLSSESRLPGGPSGNTLPKVDEPYPPIRVERPNLRYAQILQEDFAGTVSEMTAITQYLYHHFDMEPALEEVAELLEGISIVEMTHLEMLGELIKMLGGDPVYQGSSGRYWTGSLVEYIPGAPCRQIIVDIQGEEAAIRQYEYHISLIDDQYIKAILRRIIKDEMLHIKLLREAYERHCR